jgi:hypothetical protein
VACDWLHFAERTGRAGHDWAATYRRHLPAVALSDRALALMRKGEIEEGRRVLREFAYYLSALRDEQDSVSAVLYRWHHGVAGYYFYSVGNFQQAQESMNQAHEAVKRAISSADWLIMLAVHCQEFCLHQARIARNQRRWPEMNTFVAQAQGMMLDHVPLCEKINGQKIYFSTFRRFFAQIVDMTAEESSVAAKIVDQGERSRLFDQFVRRMLRFQEIGIEYQS